MATGMIGMFGLSAMTGCVQIIEKHTRQDDEKWRVERIFVYEDGSTKEVTNPEGEPGFMFPALPGWESITVRVPPSSKNGDDPHTYDFAGNMEWRPIIAWVNVNDEEFDLRPAEPGSNAYYGEVAAAVASQDGRVLEIYSPYLEDKPHGVYQSREFASVEAWLSSLRQRAIKIFERKK